MLVRKSREEAELELRREAEVTRRRELAEMFQQFHEMDGERRHKEVLIEREASAARRQEESDMRRELRKEDDLARERRELLGEKLKSLGSYKEGNELGGYLEKFERILGESGVSERDWVERLYPRLPERLCSRVAEARDSRASYGEIKRILLKASGETAVTYGNQLFEVTGEFFKSKTAGEIAEWLRRIAGGMYRECKGVEDCILAVALALLRRVLPQSGKTFLELRKIGNWGELREVLEDWLSGRQRGNYYKPLGFGESFSQRGLGGPASGGYASSGSSTYVSEVRGGSERFGVVKCFNCGEAGHRAFECKKGTSSSSKPGQGTLPRSPTCYSCGKPGHRSPECPDKKVGTPVKKEGGPKKISMLKTGGRGGNIAVGLVNGVRAEILIDSGAELGSVPRGLVPVNAQMCEDVYVRGPVGKEQKCQSLMADFVVGGFYKRVRAIIDDDSCEGAVCIIPFNVTDRKENEAFAKAIEECPVREIAEVGVLTRSQSRVQGEEEINDRDVQEVHEWSSIEPDEGAGEVSRVPEGNSGGGISREKREAVGSNTGGGSSTTRGESSVVESEESGVATSLEAVSSGGEELEQVIEAAKDIGPVSVGKDREKFREAVKSDDSLKEWRELGDREERGFKWKDGVLLRGVHVGWEEFREVLALPREYRERVMKLGHDRNGHLGAEKVHKLISRYFVWPSMARDLIAYCGSCELCQRKSKVKPRRAPIVERPILAEPFESVAIDLVGPLPKGKGGNRYLLTYVCLATRWPEAVPLRNITARSVVEGLWSIFSRTSIPELILSDQGSQFCGRMMKEFSGWLGIDKIRTSPYHPESNGSVERLHGTLKAILGKGMDQGLDWVRQVNFALFVLRQMPHADSGFSPFDLVYGFRVRTPLDALYHGLVDAEERELNVCDWVCKMAERLEVVSDYELWVLLRGERQG